MMGHAVCSPAEAAQQPEPERTVSPPERVRLLRGLALLTLREAVTAQRSARAAFMAMLTDGEGFDVEDRDPQHDEREITVGYLDAVDRAHLDLLRMVCAVLGKDAAAELAAEAAGWADGQG